jgi:hypothetical protein
MPAVKARTMAEITAAAHLVDCGLCRAHPGEPCIGTPGTHLARYDRARRRGLLSGADETAVLAAVIASEIPAIVMPAARGPAVAA